MGDVPFPIAGDQEVHLQEDLAALWVRVALDGAFGALDDVPSVFGGTGRAGRPLLGDAPRHPADDGHEVPPLELSGITHRRGVALVLLEGPQRLEVHLGILLLFVLAVLEDQAGLLDEVQLRMLDVHDLGPVAPEGLHLLTRKLPQGQLQLEVVGLRGPRLPKEAPDDEVRVEGQLQPGLLRCEVLLEDREVLRPDLPEALLDLDDQIRLLRELNDRRGLEEHRSIRTTGGTPHLLVGVHGLEQLDLQVRGLPEDLLVDEALEEPVLHHELLGVHLGRMPIDELTDEELFRGPEELGVELREGVHGPDGHLRRIPPEGPLHEVCEGHLLLRDGHDVRGGHEALQHLHLVSALVFVLVLVAPEAHIHLEVLLDVLREDPPPMAIGDHLLEGRVPRQEVREVTCRRRPACLEDPEGEVEVRPGEGPVEGLRLVHEGHEGRTLREPHVVVEEVLPALLALELHANPHLRPGPVEALRQEALEDPMVQVHDIGRSSVAVQRGNEDRARVQLFRLPEEDPLVEDLFDPVGQLPHLPHVTGVSGLRGLEVDRRHREDRSGRGTKGPQGKAPEDRRRRFRLKH